jgi:7-cyano-7-deazaguanine reductase
MSIGSNQSEITKSEIDVLAAKHLGQKGGEGYSDQYDPSLLVFIPRHLNRKAYGIEDDKLPFIGFDVWNAYEVSAITKKGLPVAGMLKIIYPSNSPVHVESKSIKLYLNSFNMTPLGNNRRECIELIEQIVKDDLERGLGSSVRIKMFTSTDAQQSHSFSGFYTLEDYIDNVDDLVFESYTSDKDQLQVEYTSKTPMDIKYHTSLLRSNCRVTNQPDWGDVFIHMNTKNIPDGESLLRYIVSHRKVNHFHEEICEMVFAHLMEVYKPEDLMVSCLYLRRGGIDINPIRATSSHLIPIWYDSQRFLIKKTMRQ